MLPRHYWHIFPDSAMARCLGITELLAMIVQALPTKKDQVALACAARVFYNPAMDAVWCDLPGLGPLVLCLPEARSYKRDVFRYITIRKQSAWEDSAGFDRHARRVRSLKIEPHTQSTVNKPFWIDRVCWRSMEWAYHNRSDKRILPNLRALEWGDTRRYYHGDFSCLLHDKVQSIHISSHDIGPRMTERDERGEGFPIEGLTLENLGKFLQKSKSVRLKNFALHPTYSRQNYAVCDLSPLLCCMHDLTTLEIGPSITAAALLHLGALPYLRSLSLRLPIDIWEGPPYAPTSKMFAFLSVLHVTIMASDMGPLLSFLESISSIKLLEFGVRFLQVLKGGAAREGETGVEGFEGSVIQPTTKSYGALFSTLLKFDKLQHLEASLAEPRVPRNRPRSDDKRFLLCDEDVSPLLNFKDMRHCDLAPTPIKLSRAFAENLTESWPHLEYLALGSSFPFHPDMRVDHPVLLSTNYPNTVSLKVRVGDANRILSHPRAATPPESEALQLNSLYLYSYEIKPHHVMPISRITSLTLPCVLMLAWQRATHVSQRPPVL